MAATNIKSVLELLRTKVYNASSSTSLDELNSMVKAAQLAHTPMIRHYDSDGSLPTATSSEERLAFITSTGSIKMNNGRRWEATTSSSSGGGGPTFSYQGSAYGYIGGGQYPSGATNSYEKFSLTSDGNGTDTADLTLYKSAVSGMHSDTTSYYAGGMNWPGGYLSTNDIAKFPFATDGDATDAGDLTAIRDWQTSHSSGTHGYIAGGQPNTNIIDKFDMATDGNATDVGDLTDTMYMASGASDVSAAYGYVYSGKLGPSGDISGTNKFSFASDGNATTVTGVVWTHPSGYNYRAGVGANSTTHAYQMGAEAGMQTVSNDIAKFPFAAENAIATVGELTKAKAETGFGNSSTTYAYHSGGATPGFTNVIEKIDFSSDGNATDVGDLAISRKRGAEGTQV